MGRAIKADRLGNEIASRIAELSSRTTPKMRSVRREYSRLLAEAPPDEVIQIAFGLVSRSDFGCRFVGYEIVRDHKAAFMSLTPDQLLKLGQGINSWSTVDCFACYLAGPAWRDGRLSDSTIRDWARSSDRWFRRAALVSTIALSRRANIEDVSRTIEICSLLVSDHDDMVVKALSWALRELAKKHVKEARTFLALHRRSLAARVTREVQNKIATGLKNPRKSA